MIYIEDIRARFRQAEEFLDERSRRLFAANEAMAQRTVANLLRHSNYHCQANRKTRESANHPDRDAQFGDINATVREAIAAGEPAISPEGR